jgi:flavodoxin
MNALVIYDSVFGNTEKIAQEISAALASQGRSEALPVSQVTAERLNGVELLIAGSPTRGFRPTEAISQFLKTADRNRFKGMRVAAFDTRIWLDTIQSSTFRFIVNTGGYAASSIAKALEKKGGRLLAPPEGFLVTGEQGPLKEGELERAADWVMQIAAKN